MSNPVFYIIAGPNGAGKTTVAMKLLPNILNCHNFINADEIAKGLNPLNPEEKAMEAGRIQIRLIEENIEEKNTFAVETTLATLRYQNVIKRAKENGFKVDLYFFWLPNPQDAIERVKRRVSLGGHNIPTPTIIQRYKAGLNNLRNIYMNLVDNWYIFDNYDTLTQISKSKNGLITVLDKTIHDKIFSSNGQR